MCNNCKEKPVEKYYTRGRFKGYLRTCKDCYKYHHRKGPNHPNATKGGRRKNEQGYVQILDPRKTTGCRYILEHRLVMENVIGRPLTKDEVVHHLNGIRDDNRPENLVVLGPADEHENRTYIKALQQRVRELEQLVNVE